METEVVTPRKSPITEVTLERLHSSVFPVVSGQLVWPGKLPVTSLPAAAVRLLPRVGPLVSLQVGALGVDLFNITMSGILYLQSWGSSQDLIWYTEELNCISLSVNIWIVGKDPAIILFHTILPSRHFFSCQNPAPGFGRAGRACWLIVFF